MPNNYDIHTSVSAFGQTIAKTVRRTNEGGGPLEVTVPVGKAGQLTTRTDNETGTITMASGGHGITTGQVVDLYWDGGARYEVLVGTVSGTSVPIGADNGGFGSVLPTNLTNVVVSARLQCLAAMAGNPAVSAMAMMMAYSSASEESQAYVEFRTAADAATAGAVLLNANEPRVWDIAGGVDYPLEDTAAMLYVSNGSATNEGTFTYLWLQDSTP